jgi:hypothetical protein
MRHRNINAHQLGNRADQALRLPKRLFEQTTPYRAVFIKNLLRYLAEKIWLLNTIHFREDYRSFAAP